MKHIGVSAYTDCLHMSFAVFLLTSALVACNAMSHPKFQLESTMCIQNFKPGSTDKNSDAHRLPPNNDRNKLILDRNCVIDLDLALKSLWMLVRSIRMTYHMFQ